jgi:hypothetical protein
MAKGRKKPDYGVDRDTFIRFWEEGDTLDEAYQMFVEFARARGLPVIPKPVMCARASEYRSMGYDLKKHKPGRKRPESDVEEVNRMIAEIRARKAAEAKGNAKAATKNPAPVIDPQALLEALQKLFGSLASPPTPGSPS